MKTPNPWLMQARESSPNGVLTLTMKVLPLGCWQINASADWIQDWRIPLDFTKGFTNTPGRWRKLRCSRIALLKRWLINLVGKPRCLHNPWAFAPDTEEKELYACWWCLNNRNQDYSEAAMDIHLISHMHLTWRGWPASFVYMESHDEERLMYKTPHVVFRRQPHSESKIALRGCSWCTFLIYPALNDLQFRNWMMFRRRWRQDRWKADQVTIIQTRQKSFSDFYRFVKLRKEYPCSGTSDFTWSRRQTKSIQPSTLRWK
jgi:hypothetical protein